MFIILNCHYGIWLGDICTLPVTIAHFVIQFSVLMIQKGAVTQNTALIYFIESIIDMFSFCTEFLFWYFSYEIMFKLKYKIKWPFFL